MANSNIISKKVSVIRGGEKVSGADRANRFIEDYVLEIIIMESINAPAIEMHLVFNDYANLAQVLTGTELFKVEISTENSDRIYFMRGNGYANKVRDGQGAEAYMIKCFSDEYAKNEGRSIFGHTSVLFGDTEASNIVKSVIRDKRYLNSTKRVYVEESLNFHSAVIPNWRPFEVCNFLAERSYRKNKTDASRRIQSGFQFFENGMGYNFKTIDRLIEDIKDAKQEVPTNPKTGEASIYEYVLSPANIRSDDDGDGSDYFNLHSFIVTEENNLFKRMRNGLISGYSIGFDPISLDSSQVGLSKDFSEDRFKYHISDMWKDMSHLDTRLGRNPANVIDSTIKDYVDTPRRIRYNILPNRVFDTRKSVNNLNYSEISMMDTYDYVRRSSLDNITAKCRVNGNLDLYAGKGIKIKIPSTEPIAEGRGYDNDPRYSGMYLITDVTHQISGEQMFTILNLKRDAIPT